MYAQEIEKPKNWQLNGYVKDLMTVNVGADSTMVDNLIHNRMNFKWYPTEKLNFYFEVRNRIFHGDLVKSIPQYADFVDVGNDYFDLSYQTPKGKSWLFQSMIDRAYLEWYGNEWEIRLGRQRVNWGVNLVWNPNDLFNAYSFFDFDYEERPGSDAIRIRKYIGYAGSLELVSNFSEEIDEVVMAGMWKTNRWNYDFQFLSGKAREDLVLGMGWAGSIGDAGFKGEATYFYPYTNERFLDEALLASLTVDYSFENSLYLNGSVLFNSDGSENTSFDGLAFASSGLLTARNLSPFKYSTFVQAGYSFHPLINGGLAVIYYPSSRNTVFINPNVTFSVKPNLDLDLIGQFFLDDQLGEYRAIAKLFYARVKWSF
ncbi:MAG: hypothetical protein ABJF11_00560 [Reichenbachiella sp.]|uniref:hypothetical protein n=1 Tax=Reichenbachiella sp. TaxID=2184521 RepID=UPI003265A289